MSVRLESIEDGIVVFSKDFPTYEDAVEYCLDHGLDHPTFKIGS